MKMTLFAIALGAVFPPGGQAVGQAASASETAPPPDQALTALIERLRRRDTTAFEPFIRKTESLGFRLAYHITGDYHIAQDILQEAYLIIFKKINTLKEPGAFRAWFSRIVSNLSIEHLRKSEKALSLEATQLLESIPAPAQQTFADSCVSMEDLRRALSALTPRERTALILREFLSFTYSEMGSVLDIPLGTVKSRLAEARHKLARLIAGKEERI